MSVPDSSSRNTAKRDVRSGTFLENHRKPYSILFITNQCKNPIKINSALQNNKRYKQNATLTLHNQFVLTCFVTTPPAVAVNKLNQISFILYLHNRNLY